MVTVKGESIWWTNSLRSLDICPLRAFIMKSILSFIICISATMCGGAISVLGALLAFGPSRSLLSVLMPFCSSSWLLGLASLWRSYSSRSWFCLVRHSSTATRVCTYLSKAVMRGFSLLLVAIKQVSTMQLFIWEAIVWTLIYLLFPTNDAN